MSVPGVAVWDGPNNGRIELIFGPMFSGKTSELIRRIRRYKHAKHRCVLLKWKADTRYSESKAATHDKQEEDAVPVCHLPIGGVPVDGAPDLRDTQVIGIDEGQFFGEIYDFAEWAVRSGKTVIIAALDGTFQRKPFGRVLELVPLADAVTKLNAVCMKCCALEAPFSKRITNELDIQVIGGAEKYIAVCRKCYV